MAGWMGDRGWAGFGIERLGLVAVRAPVLTLALLAVATLAAAFGATNLKTAGLLVEFLRSSTSEFRAYERFRKEFPSSDRDVLIVVQSKDLFVREHLQRIRDLHIELQLADPVAHVLSMFTVPDAPDSDGYLRPLFPDQLPDEAGIQSLKERAWAHPLINGRLLAQAADRQATLLLVSLLPQGDTVDEHLASLRVIEAHVRQFLGPDLTYHLIGAPVIAVEVAATMRRDRIVFNIIGLLACTLVGFMIFPSLRLVAIVAACPLMALIWSLGFLGWSGIEMSTIMNAITPLVIAVTFCDAMHMMHGIRNGLNNGETPHEAVRHALKSVGPACVLTSLTIAVSLLSFIAVDSDIIVTFGCTSALAIMLALLVVLLLIPAAGILFVRVDEARGANVRLTPAAGEALLNRTCAWFAAWVPGRALLVTILTALLTVVFTVLHFQLRPVFRLSDQAPDGVRATLDDTAAFGALAFAYPIHVVVRGPAGEPIRSAPTKDVVRAARDTLERQSVIARTWSIELIRDWLAGHDAAGQGLADRFLEKIPPHLKQRFVNEETGTTLVTGYMPDLNAVETLRLVATINADLDRVRARYPDFELTVTGLPVVAAVQSTRMIDQLNSNMLSSIGQVLLVMGVAFRSIVVVLLSIGPNFLPLVSIGATLWLMGEGLDYATVIALTVAFGIAVDNTIQFLNRFYMELESRRFPGPVEAAAATIVEVGPIMIANSLVLVFGLGATVLSGLPPTRVFGILSIVALAGALLADLVITPAVVILWHRLVRTS